MFRSELCLIKSSQGLHGQGVGQQQESGQSRWAGPQQGAGQKQGVGQWLLSLSSGHQCFWAGAPVAEEQL